MIERDVLERTRPPSLWRNRDFMLLWSGETISQMGTQITQLALPLTAVLVLNASPSDIGILNGLAYVPFIGFALYAGVWVDRCRRRPIMITSNVSRCLILCTIPVLAHMDVLRIGWVYVSALLLGTFTMLFDVCYQSYLPALVDREQLTNGNSKLESSASLALAAGPGIGGILVQLLTAPFALLANSFSLLVSVVTLSAIRRREPKPVVPAGRRQVVREIREGLGFTFSNPYLRACALTSGVYNMFWNAQQTVFVVYASRVLHMSPGLIGMTMGIGALGAVLGAATAEPLGKRFGVGLTIVGALVTTCTAPLLMPLAWEPGFFSVAVLFCSFLIGGVGLATANVHIVSLRQAITPPRLLGRANASYRFMTWGPMPLGGLLGGVLSEVLGFHATLIMIGLGFAASCLWVVLSPLHRVHVVPEQAT